MTQANKAHSQTPATQSLEEKQAQKEYFGRIANEFTPQSGLLEVRIGILVIIYALYALAKQWSYQPPSDLVEFGMFVVLMVLFLFSGAYEKRCIKRKYPELTHRNLNTITTSLGQLIAVPGIFGMMVFIAVLDHYNVSLPGHLFDIIVLYLGFGVVVVTLMLHFLLKFGELRFLGWYIYVQLVALSPLLYPESWTKFYLKVGVLGIAMVLAGIVVQIKFVAKLKIDCRE